MKSEKLPFSGVDYDEDDAKTDLSVYADAKMSNSKTNASTAYFGDGKGASPKSINDNRGSSADYGAGPKTDDICANYPNPYSGGGKGK